MVSEFQGRFEAMANQTNDISEGLMVRLLISWLREDIKGSVFAHGPKSFEEALDLAHTHEKRIQSRPPLRHLTHAEIQSRRERGLCCYCEEKYTVVHKCKTPPHLLLLTDGTDMDPLLPDPFVTDDILAEDLQCIELQEHSAISYNALAGGSSPSTLRFTRQMNGTLIQILVHGGSTHNFIQERVARFLQLSIETISSFPVVVRSGQRLRCDGVARGLMLLIQGTTLTEDLYILSLHGADLVLGVSWLAKLGPVVTNYATRTLEFNLGGNQLVWQGVSPTDVKPVQLHSLRRMAATEAIASSFCLEIVTGYNSVTEQPTVELETLLELYADVFQKPSEWPPSRIQDHAIHLNSGAQPVMEQMVSEMLKEGVNGLVPVHSHRRYCYQQIRVMPEDVSKTAFRTHDGHYDFLVMPFGLTNAPSTFQATMNDIFKPHLRRFVLVFFDDILVYNPTWNTHLEHLEIVLKLLRQHQLVAKHSKCLFGQSSVDYLGHIISAQGLAVNPDKIEVIQQWLPPKTVKETPTSGQRQSSRPLTLLRPNWFLLLSYLCLTLAKNFRLRLMPWGKALMKDSHLHPTGLLQHLPIPDQVFEDIAMDFITCLPSSKGKTTIMTVVDRLTKYGHFIPLPSTFSTYTVAEAFVIWVIRLHGTPRTIVTDRDPRFLHSFWQEIHRLQGSTLSMSTTYHPQTNGQFEALNKCVEQYIRCYVDDVPATWVSMLPWDEFWYNTSYQTSAGMAPF
ncbi:uncharacterized protein [Solanum lycopersicum]|uniref:uncharacterized protein n=1 Tax=Solanum lycopersicum TaxID=4081 RepID=UPI00374A937F